jgi:hypothetical protein
VLLLFTHKLTFIVLLLVDSPAHYPLWLNHVQHTAPIFIAFIELLLVDYIYGSLLLELFVIVSFGGSYLAFALYLKKANGWYPYPFMEQFTTGTWVVFIIVACIFAALAHVTGRVLAQLIHRNNVSKVTTSTKETKQQKARKSKKID